MVRPVFAQPVEVSEKLSHCIMSLLDVDQSYVHGLPRPVHDPFDGIIVLEYRSTEVLVTQHSIELATMLKGNGEAVHTFLNVADSQIEVFASLFNKAINLVDMLL